MWVNSTFYFHRQKKAHHSEEGWEQEYSFLAFFGHSQAPLALSAFLLVHFHSRLLEVSPWPLLFSLPHLVTLSLLLKRGEHRGGCLMVSSLHSSPFQWSPGHFILLASDNNLSVILWGSGIWEQLSRVILAQGLRRWQTRLAKAVVIWRLDWAGGAPPKMVLPVAVGWRPQFPATWTSSQGCSQRGSRLPPGRVRERAKEWPRWEATVWSPNLRRDVTALLIYVSVLPWRTYPGSLWEVNCTRLWMPGGWDQRDYLRGWLFTDPCLEEECPLWSRPWYYIDMIIPILQGRKLDQKCWVTCLRSHSKWQNWT